MSKIQTSSQPYKVLKIKNILVRINDIFSIFEDI